MDLIDILKAEAAAGTEPIDRWLNGIPIRVFPDGTVTVRDTITVEAEGKVDE